MKKDDLKKLIKPLVKECIHEVLLEEGLLSNVVAEVAKGMQGNLVVETKTPQRPQAPTRQKTRNDRAKLTAHRKKLMESVGSGAYNGIDLFEGTQPMSNYEASAPAAGGADLGNPKYSGVDISSLVGDASKIWQAMK